jgi:hypothetical protein
MGAALVCEVTGLAADACEGALLAATAIDDGRAARLLDVLPVRAEERSA